MLRVPVALIRISPGRKLHKSLKCQTLRDHHSQQMAFFPRRLPFCRFFVAILLGPAARRRCCGPVCNYLKRLYRRRNFRVKRAPQTKLNPVHAGASCWVESKSRSSLWPRPRWNQLTPGRPPFNTGPAETPLQLSTPGPTPARAPNYPASATRATPLIRPTNNGGGLHWPWLRFD